MSARSSPEKLSRRFWFCWAALVHLFHGSARDATTVPQVLADLEQRFGLWRVVFVGDRGMVTSANLALLRTRQQGYVVGLWCASWPTPDRIAGPAPRRGTAQTLWAESHLTPRLFRQIVGRIVRLACHPT